MSLLVPLTINSWHQAVYRHIGLSLSVHAVLCCEDDIACPLHAWLPVYNHDLGGAPEYDDAILWLNNLLFSCVWCPEIQTGPVHPAFSVGWTAIPAIGSYGSYFLMYAQWRNLGVVLTCFEKLKRRVVGRYPEVPWRGTFRHTGGHKKVN